MYFAKAQLELFASLPEIMMVFRSGSGHCIIFHVISNVCSTGPKHEKTIHKNCKKNESGNHPAIWIRSDVCLQLSIFKNIFATDSKAPPDPGEAIAMPEAIASPSHMHLEQRSS